MKKTLHTPGPWKHDPTWGIIKHGKSEICALHSGNLANAHLISAAPDLLSALEGFIDLYLQGQLILEGDNGNDPLILKAIHTLRKAKGEA
jgi:hypothetical protein